MRLPLKLALFIAVSSAGALPAVSARQDAAPFATNELASPPSARSSAETGRPIGNADYALRARLDTVEHRILGEGTLAWRNRSSRPASELRFHLYWNAWRDRFSSWLREAAIAGGGSLGNRSEADRGWIDITQFRIAGEDYGGRLAFMAPDDGNRADRTLVSVVLDRPVAPGETVEIEFAWTAQVPRTYARTGVIGDYYFIAHWFPKIGVLENDGWHAHQFHAATEFFADYGAYDVELTVPAGWTVGATGREVARTDNGNGTSTHRYAAADVHDFAWTTSPDFVEVRERFAAPGLPPVNLRLLMQPEHQRQAARHAAALRTALEQFGRWFGPYAYSEITMVDPVTIVDPAVQGSDSAGMEYPMLITGATSWVAPDRHVDPESVIAHETGHQYWHSAVGTNEVEHAWMDEGLTTYAESRLLAEAYPGRFVTIERYFGGLVIWPYEDAPWMRSVHGDGANSYRQAPNGDVPAAPSWQYDPETGRVITYFRTTLWLHTLERMLGWDTMQRVLQTFYERSLFRHPQPEDFFRIATEISGQDLAWFFEAVHGEASTFDYAVGDVVSFGSPAGSFDSRVSVKRLGTGVFPVAVRVTFADGATVTERWDGRDPWHAFHYERPARVASVEVDPERVLRLDVQQTNNSWTDRPVSASAASKWTLRWWSWLQHQMLTYAFFV